MKLITSKSMIFISALMILIISCSKDKIENNHSILLYKNSDKGDSTSSGYLLGNSVNEVSKIFFNNSLFDSLINNEDWKQLVDAYTFDFNNITLTSYFGSKIRVITIPVKNISITSSNIYLNIYELNNHFVITKMHVISLQNNNRQILVSTIRDEVYYQFEIDKFDKIGNWDVKIEVPLNKTFNGTSKSNISTNAIHTEESFMKCMDRLITQVCGGSWVCAIMCGAALPSCLAGAALACVVK